MTDTERSAATSGTRDAWAPDSWKNRHVTQQANYPDLAELENVLVRLAELPPLVTSWEILALREQIAEAQKGKRFLLQGGDCAESFAECSSPVITNRLKVLLQMSLALVHGLRLGAPPSRRTRSARVRLATGEDPRPKLAPFHSHATSSSPKFSGVI